MSQAATARMAQDAADRERSLVPDTPGPTLSSDGRKLAVQRRNDAQRRYAL